MLPGLVGHSGPVLGPRSTMREVIHALGLNTGLKLCLDAGDVNSYAGTGQVWSDLSGGGYDFNRGTTSGAQATDPTFNGAAGGQSSSEYWSFDGGDYFTYDTTNETWMNNLHKNSAIWAFAAWCYVTTYPAAGFGAFFMGDADPAGFHDGINIFCDSAGLFRLNVFSVADTVLALDMGTIPKDDWVFVGITLDEPAGTATMQINDTQAAKTSTYASPATANASHTLQIGTGGNGNYPLKSGSRLASVNAWEGTALTAAEMDAIYEVTKTKFGH